MYTNLMRRWNCPVKVMLSVLTEPLVTMKLYICETFFKALRLQLETMIHNTKKTQCWFGSFHRICWQYVKKNPLIFNRLKLMRLICHGTIQRSILGTHATMAHGAIYGNLCCNTLTVLTNHPSISEWATPRYSQLVCQLSHFYMLQVRFSMIKATCLRNLWPLGNPMTHRLSQKDRGHTLSWCKRGLHQILYVAKVILSPTMMSSDVLFSDTTGDHFQYWWSPRWLRTNNWFSLTTSTKPKNIKSIMIWNKQKILTGEAGTRD